MISYDFETYLISAEEPSPKPVCLSWYDGKDKGIIVGMKPMETYLKSILTGKEIIIAHNMRYEALVINRWFPELRGLLFDKLKRNELACTKLYEKLINCTVKKPLFSVSLADLVKHYFKVDISEDKKKPDAWRLRYHELEGVPLEEWPKEAVDYSISDSVWAYKIYTEQLKTPMSCGLAVAAEIYLNLMGQYGLLVDQNRVDILEKELLAKLTPWYEDLCLVGIVSKVKDKHGEKYKKNINEFRKYIETNVKLKNKTPKGATATSSEYLQYYLGQGLDAPVEQALNTYLNVMKYEKILTAFVSRLKQANPVIRTDYSAVVNTGRTSSSSSTLYPSVNIQQMPRDVKDVTYDIRGCFVPRPGYKICSIDYSGLELSSTANQLYRLTGKHDMRDIINSGDTPVDIHSMLAYRLMNLKTGGNETYESFKRQKKLDGYKEFRQLAKPINLGFPGGIGYDTMRTLLARDNIHPKLQILKSCEYEQPLLWEARVCRREGYPVRVRQTGAREFQLVYDELVSLKSELFALYPDLEFFLKEGHKDYLTGESKKMKNEFGEWEDEPLYAFTVGDFQRDNCMYTQVCNGLLMQCPAAIGAKRAMCHIIDKYKDSRHVKPLAFIHDEIVFEILDSDHREVYIQDVSEILIDQMQTVLTEVRIAVEAEVFDYWKKAGGDWSKTYFKDAKNKELKSGNN